MPKRRTVSGEKCTACNGSGRCRAHGDGCEADCQACNGEGMVAAAPPPEPAAFVEVVPGVAVTTRGLVEPAEPPPVERDLRPPWTLYVADGEPIAVMPSMRPGDVFSVKGWSMTLAERVVAGANAAMHAAQPPPPADAMPSTEEADAILRDAGEDPKAVGKRGAEFIAQLHAAAKELDSKPASERVPNLREDRAAHYFAEPRERGHSRIDVPPGTPLADAMARESDLVERYKDQSKYLLGEVESYKDMLHKEEAEVKRLREALLEGCGHFVGHDLDTLASRLEDAAEGLRSGAKEYDDRRAALLKTPEDPNE